MFFSDIRINILHRIFNHGGNKMDMETRLFLNTSVILDYLINQEKRKK